MMRTKRGRRDGRQADTTAMEGSALVQIATGTKYPMGRGLVWRIPAG